MKGWWKAPRGLYASRFSDMSEASQLRWYRAMDASSSLDSDGILTAEQLKKHCDIRTRHIAELVGAGLLKHQENSYFLEGFLDLQVPSEKRALGKQKAAKRKEKWKMERRSDRRSEPPLERDYRGIEVKEEEKLDLSALRSEISDFSPPSLPSVARVPPVVVDGFPEQLERRHGERREPRQTKNLLASSYADRYKKHTGGVWMSWAKNDRDIQDVARYVDAQPEADRERVISEILDGFFADAWAKNAHWPWGSLARDPHKYRSGALAASGDAQMEKMNRLRDAAYEAARIGDSALYERLMEEKGKLHDQIFGKLAPWSR